MAQNWHFWSIWARPCRLIQCPVVGRLVVVARGLYLARHLFTLSINSVQSPNLTVHTSNRSQVFNTLRRLHHFGCMQQLLPINSSICNKYQSYGQYGCPQHFKIAKCLFVTNNQTIIRFSHNSCCSIAFKAFLQVFVGHNC